VEITNGSGSVLATTTISGVGSTPEVQVSPTYLPFGAVPFGRSETLPVTVTNSGAGTLTIVTSISGSSNYKVTGSTCEPGVTAGNSCTLQVEFTPTSIATHDAVLTVSTNAGNATVGLAGTGSGLTVLGGVNGLSLEFGTVSNSSTKVVPLTVTNVGLPGTVTVGTAITVGTTKTPTTTYQVLTTSQNTCLAGITARQSCVLPIEFAPTSSGTHDDLLTLTPNTGTGPTTVWLLGSSVAAPGQSVTFAGLQTILPISGLNGSRGVAVDRAGDVFVSDYDRVVELPQTPTGYGPQISLPFSQPYDVAVDSAGDVIAVSQRGGFVQELPWTGTGYGPRIRLGFDGLNFPAAVAVDNAGDVFVGNSQGSNTQESPWTGTGYGPAVVLPLSGLIVPWGVAVDHAGDLLVADAGDGDLLEFPKTSTGYGQSATLTQYGGPYPAIEVTLDNAGDAFVSGDQRVVELPKTPTGYGPPTTVPTFGVVPPAGKVAIDSAGDVFIDTSDGHVVKVQTQTSVYVCAPGQTIPAPCSVVLTFHFNVYSNLTLGTPVVLTSGAPNLDFTLGSGSTCTGALAENSACTVNVTFAPLASGVRNGTVEVVDSGGNILATATFSGTGIAPPTGSPVAQLSTAYLPFASAAIGSIQTLPVMVTNAGGGTLTAATALSGSSNYLIAGNTCEGGVTPGDSCAVVVEFAPTSIATHDGLLTVQTNGGNPTVGLKGSGVGLSVLGGVSGGKLQFGSVASGSTEVETLTVTNIGLPGTIKIGTAIKAGSDSGPYTILTTAENTCQPGIAAGQSCTLPIEFAPTTSGTHDDLLTLTPGAAGGSTTVWLLGTTP
jgi:hypothetical protein